MPVNTNALISRFFGCDSMQGGRFIGNSKTIRFD